MTGDHDNSELLLTAFRYVAGELPADEAADFETALSVEQSARDALTDVVELSEAVAVEEFDRIHPMQLDATTRSRRTFRRWGIIVAVCILVVACFIVLENHHPPDLTGSGDIALPTAGRIPLPVTDDAHSVLALWSELGDNPDLFGSDAFQAEETETTTSVINEVPDWMLMAVVNGAIDPGSDLPEEMRELMDELDRENL